MRISRTGQGSSYRRVVASRYLNPMSPNSSWNPRQDRLDFRLEAAELQVANAARSRTRRRPETPSAPTAHPLSTTEIRYTDQVLYGSGGALL